MVTVPTMNPSFLLSPKIQDTTLTIKFNATLQKRYYTCNCILTVLIGSTISLTSLLQVSQSVTLSH